ncbi:MAG: tyrosine-type recombinase/integrase [Synergistaceae bacterium]|jgi:integrase|nr:tyrosine-type recombinase/integrase [Synergistaceae bacterium]
MLIVDPIKDIDKIERMKRILQSQSQRNLLLFVMGINTPLRVNDLLQLKVGDVLDEDENILSVISVCRKKTGKCTQIFLNDTVKEAMEGYPPLQNERDAALFPAWEVYGRQRNSPKNKIPLSRIQVYRIMRGAAEQAGLSKVGAQTLRKTFGYQVFQKTGRLKVVQELLNQDSLSHLTQYIGLKPENPEDMDEAVRRAYLELNL